MKVCKKCGYINKDDAKTCQQCGIVLNDKNVIASDMLSDEPKKESKPSPVSAAHTYQEHQGITNAPHIYSQNKETRDNEDKAMRGEVIAVFFLSFFLGFIGSIIAANLLNKKPDNHYAGALKSALFLGMFMTFVWFVVLSSVNFFRS